MALIKFGAGVVGMSGSIAGTTFARNRYGSYARAKTKPINPNTSGQQAVRNAMTNLTARWSQTLTGVQRTAWNLYAASVAMKNRLGETVFLTGFNHYIRSNSLLVRSGLTEVDDGPTLFELPEIEAAFAITASEATQLVSVSFTDLATWVNEDDAHMFVFLGQPQNAQRNFFAGPWKLGTELAGDSITPLTTPQTFTAPFVVTEDQRVWAYARIIRADGRLSEPFRSDVAVGA